MASLQGIKQRIRSVTGTRQITKAMQLVAASKLRRAQTAATEPQAYTEAARELLQALSVLPEAGQNPLFEVRTVRRALTIIIGGDRGMAGAYSGNIVKAFRLHNDDLGLPQSIIAVGRKVSLAMARVSDIDTIASYEMDANEADDGLARPILHEAIELFITGKVDTVHLAYTRFRSTIKQEAVVEQLLPVTPAGGDHPAERVLEPEPEVVLDYVTKRVLTAQVLQAVLEARASEQAARMVAMLNATDNANDLIDDYTLAYNNARQAAITQELAEITAGTEAQLA